MKFQNQRFVSTRYIMIPILWKTSWKQPMKRPRFFSANTNLSCIYCATIQLVWRWNIVSSTLHSRKCMRPCTVLSKQLTIAYIGALCLSATTPDSIEVNVGRNFAAAHLLTQARRQAVQIGCATFMVNNKAPVLGFRRHVVKKVPGSSPHSHRDETRSIIAEANYGPLVVQNVCEKRGNETRGTGGPRLGKMLLQKEMLLNNKQLKRILSLACLNLGMDQGFARRRIPTRLYCRKPQDRDISHRHDRRRCPRPLPYRLV